MIKTSVPPIQHLINQSQPNVLFFPTLKGSYGRSYLTNESVGQDCGMVVRKEVVKGGMVVI
jgi:hypothetical protein